MFTKEQAEIVAMCGVSTHTIWRQEFAKEASKAFGFTVKTRVFHNEDTLKGAHLKDGADTLVGVDSEGTLCQIANHLGHQWGSSMNYDGRGFRVSAMANELLEAFGTEADVETGA